MLHILIEKMRKQPTSEREEDEEEDSGGREENVNEQVRERERTEQRQQGSELERTQMNGVEQKEELEGKVIDILASLLLLILCNPIHDHCLRSF